MRRNLLVLIAASLLLAAPVHAQRQKSVIPDTDDAGRRGEIARAAQEKAGQRFLAADADKDARLSREEVARNYSFMAEKFDALDKSGDGFLNWEEFVGHSRWEHPKH